MNCDRAQAVLSDRLDGERAPERVGAAVDEHTATCARCQAFEADALRRADVRSRAAGRAGSRSGRVDHGARLVGDEGTSSPTVAGAGCPAVLARAGAAGSRPCSRRRSPGSWPEAWWSADHGRGRPPGRSPRRRSSWASKRRPHRSMRSQRRSPSRSAASRAEVPERQLRMDVAFLAPQRFRLDVHDETTYPSSRWTPTDLTFIADGSSTYRSGATGCPADLPAGGCPPTRTTITTRSVYSVQAPAPADLVLPLTTFSSADGIEVLGTDRVAGRDAIRVRLTFATGTSAVPVPGTRRNVAAVLRRRSRGPLAGCVGLVPVALHGLSVHRSVARPRGSSGSACPTNRRDEPIFDVRLTSFDPSAPDPSHVRCPRLVQRAERAARRVPRRVGYLPVTPTSPGDAARCRPPSCRPATTPTRRAPSCSTRTGWRTCGSASARLDADRRCSVRWTRPRNRWTCRAAASRTTSRRATASGGDSRSTRRATNVFLESNLPRAQLLALAASLPVRGEALPEAWRTLTGSGISIEQVAPDVALARSPIAVALPSTLPAGYVLASAQVGVGRRRCRTRRDRRQLRLPAATDRRGRRAHRPPRPGGRDALPPASSADQIARRPRRDAGPLDARARPARMDRGRRVPVVRGRAEPADPARARVAGAARRTGDP